MKKLKALCMLLCTALALTACATKAPENNGGGGDTENPNPGITVPDDGNTGGDNTGGDNNDGDNNGTDTDSDKKVSYDISVADCFGNALAGATIAVDGVDKGVTDASGKYTVADADASSRGKITVSAKGYISADVNYDGSTVTDGKASFDVKLVKEYAVVSSLEPVSWDKFEAFGLSATRDETGLMLKAESDNAVFTSSGRNSKLEICISVGAVSSVRDDNVTMVWMQSDGAVGARNYGTRAVSAKSVIGNIDTDGGKTSVTLRVPYSVIGGTKTDTVGLSMALYSDTDGARSEMLVLDGGDTVEPMYPETYIRIDRNNKVFTSNINGEPTIAVDKAALTEGYRMQFSVPELNNQSAVADDMYLKADAVADGLKISMIGFGTFTDTEYVKLIFHTSAMNGTGWNIQASDLTVLANKQKAMYRTGLTKFWTTDGGYSNFGSGESALENAPVYTEHDGYFTLELTVKYDEIPEYSDKGKVSLFAMEFADNGSANGLIYDGKSYLNGMLVDGTSQGDPAAQSSYFVIYDGAADQSLTEGYNMRFAVGAADVYAKVERGVASLKISMRGFKTFGNDDYIRLIVHNGDVSDSNAWQISRSDVSFTVFKNAMYTQTGNVGFFDNEENRYHNGTEAVHAPVFAQHDGYWDMEITVEYIELGNGIYQDTELRALLVAYTSGKLGSSIMYEGKPLGDPAYQKNWFVI